MSRRMSVSAVIAFLRDRHGEAAACKMARLERLKARRARSRSNSASGRQWRRKCNRCAWTANRRKSEPGARSTAICGYEVIRAVADMYEARASGAHRNNSAMENAAGSAGGRLLVQACVSAPNNDPFRRRTLTAVTRRNSKDSEPKTDKSYDWASVGRRLGVRRRANLHRAITLDAAGCRALGLSGATFKSA